MSTFNEYKKPVPENLEWVHLRTNSQVVRNGRYDVDAVAIDPRDNEVLVLSRQLVIVRPIKLPEGFLEKIKAENPNQEWSKI